VRRTAVIALALLVVAAACRREKEAPDAAAPNVANRVAVRPVRLYFESSKMLLAPEARNVALPENAAAAVPIVVRELLKGPGIDGSLRLFPADTVLRGAYLLPGGIAVVDLGGPTLAAGWQTGTHQELMAAHSVVQTLAANFPDVKRVRLVVNGTPAETLAGHLALDRSLTPLPALIDPAGR
jgi:spore germination protein GerM